MSAAEQIPKPLQYGASQSQARVVRQTIMPQGVSAGTHGAIVRFMLPQRAIVDLRSLSLYYTYTLAGLTAADTNFSNAQIPASYKHWRSVRFYVSGAAAAGGHCQHYDQVYHALVNASGSQDWVNSRLNNQYAELLDSSELATRPGTASKIVYVTCDDFLTLPNSKNYCIDTSLFGNVEMEVQFNDISQLKISRAGSVTSANALSSISANFSNIKLKVDTVISISPLYVSLLAERISGSDAPIRVPFQDIRSVVASNTGSNRLTVNSMCVDALLVCPFSADPNTNAGTDVGAISVNAPRYQFNSGRTDSNASETRFQVICGSEAFPRTPIDHASELADLTTNSLFGNSAKSTNLLYRDMTGGGAATAYSRSLFLAQNCVALQRFSLMTEGWSEGVMTGLNTAGQSVDFVVNTQNFGSHLLIAALCTSCLVFDPKTSAVSIES
jgi:hypothetical protein